ncbi:hypothetical protein [Micromonospora costi]|uniref:Twin-arginine translocation signal domain-containing protein n=1 Tax=Micromonospora costi TaxID=1530042 RepID=A0A3B0AC31_9ACTN|nr:hypothetical protein [Micromonospora costi]RKN58188.1 hypothetical protein D7193_06260 [Micromonospora costi]
MNDTIPSLSRRRILVGAAATSAAVTVAGPSPAHAAPSAAHAAPTGVRPGQPLVTRDRIAGARLTGGAVRVQADFADRLDDWLAFWSANSPRHWSSPVEVDGEVTSAGDTFTLLRIRVVSGDRAVDAFTAGRTDPAHLATLASLHHDFPLVDVVPGGGLRVGDGLAGFTGAPQQVAFAVAACRELWGVRTADAGSWRDQVGGRRADAWAAFTRASLRRGLRTEAY